MEAPIYACETERTRVQARTACATSEKRASEKLAASQPADHSGRARERKSATARSASKRELVHQLFLHNRKLSLNSSALIVKGPHRNRPVQAFYIVYERVRVSPPYLTSARVIAASPHVMSFVRFELTFVSLNTCVVFVVVCP